MTRIVWGRAEDRVVDAGLDRGVIYPEIGRAVPWNGLISVEDAGSSEIEEFYLDGVKYLVLVTPRDWAGKVSAYTYPPELSELFGISEMGDGLYVDSQQPESFHLSYRTITARPEMGSTQDHKIHLVYNATASLNPYSYETITSGGIDPTTFEFDLAAVPVPIPNRRPSAHIILDTSEIDQTNLSTLEKILYGSPTTAPRMPTITELIDLLKFANDVVVVYNGDGTWTAKGSNSNIQVAPDGSFFIDNVDAEYTEPGIYYFVGLDTGSSGSSLGLLVDEDGEYYYDQSETTNVSVDTDGVPFYDEGSGNATVNLDTDGTPYFTPTL